MFCLEKFGQEINVYYFIRRAHIMANLKYIFRTHFYNDVPCLGLEILGFGQGFYMK